MRQKGDPSIIQRLRISCAFGSVATSDGVGKPQSLLVPLLRRFLLIFPHPVSLTCALERSRPPALCWILTSESRSPGHERPAFSDCCDDGHGSALLSKLAG